MPTHNESAAGCDSSADLQAPARVSHSSYVEYGVARRRAHHPQAVRRLLVMDWVCLVYMAVVGLLIVRFRSNVPGWRIDAAAHLAIVLAIAGLIRVARTSPQSPGIQLWRTLYPLFCCAYAWTELDHLIPMIHGSYWATSLMIRADFMLFHVHPTVWIQRLYAPWLDEIMAGFYLSYYFFAPAVCIVFLLRRRYRDLRSIVSLVTLSHLAAYSVFFFLPALSPRMWPAMNIQYNTDYTGYLLGWLTRTIQSAGAIRGGCFPSAHVTGAVIWTLAARRYDRSLGWLLAPLTMGVAIATVYLRYHYAADVLGGFLIASTCYVAGLKLLWAHGEERPERTWARQGRLSPSRLGIGACLLFLCSLSMDPTSATSAAAGTRTQYGKSAESYVSEASVDSIAGSFDASNRAVWARTDSLYLAGAFGPPGSAQAKDGARAHLQLRVRSGMDFIHNVADARPRTFDEASLARPFENKYENYGLYPIRFLRRSTIGEGRFQMEYEYPRTYSARPLLGGVPTRSTVDTIEARSGKLSQVMGLEYLTSDYNAIEVMFGTTLRGTVTCDTLLDGPDTLEVLVLDHLEGFYVRRWGTHRLGAIAIWRSLTRGDRDPKHLRFGARAYFPGLNLRLPAFLPDLGLEDLRKFDYPAPILTVKWFERRAEHPPDWIRASTDGLLHPWNEAGPFPSALRRRFPDL